MKVSPATARTITTGSAAPTGTATTVFNIAHGVGSAPSFVSVTPKNTLSAALFNVSWDATNITITYLTGLTGALSLGWMAVS